MFCKLWKFRILVFFFADKIIWLLIIWNLRSYTQLRAFLKYKSSLMTLESKMIKTALTFVIELIASSRLYTIFKPVKLTCFHSFFFASGCDASVNSKVECPYFLRVFTIEERILGVSSVRCDTRCGVWDTFIYMWVNWLFIDFIIFLFVIYYFFKRDLLRFNSRNNKLFLLASNTCVKVL